MGNKSPPCASPLSVYWSPLKHSGITYVSTSLLYLSFNVCPFIFILCYYIAVNFIYLTTVALYILLIIFFWHSFFFWPYKFSYFHNLLLQIQSKMKIILLLLFYAMISLNCFKFSINFLKFSIFNKFLYLERKSLWV